MNLIFGGAYQGKLAYAKEHFGEGAVFVCREDQAELDFSKDTFYKLENFVLACVKEGKEAADYLRVHRREIQAKTVICTDISQGIVPVDPQLRAQREMAGRTMVYLAKEADTVIRVFCGLGQKLK